MVLKGQQFRVSKYVSREIISLTSILLQDPGQTQQFSYFTVISISEIAKHNVISSCFVCFPEEESCITFDKTQAS
jgi:hypothetical protein